MTLEEVQSSIPKYNWYHRIELAPGVVTPGVPHFVALKTIEVAG